MKISLTVLTAAWLCGLVVVEPLLVTPAQAESRDALVLKCRKAVFRAYGTRKTEPDGRRVRVLKRNFVVQQVDHCVANGGRVK